MSSRSRRSTVLHAVAVALVLASALPVSTSADARAGGGFGMGSRGGRTYSAPGFTRTAPMGAQPIQRSETPSPGASAVPGTAAPRRFGFGSGLMAGLLGAGLFGLLGGGGGFGGLFTLLLLGALIFFGWRLFRGRLAGAAGGPVFRAAPAYAGGPVPGAQPRAAQPAGGAPLALDPRDFDAFEACLVDVQTAYGREDFAALRRLATPEMVRNFERDLGDNRRRGLHNDVSEPRLLQGDLAESWREGTADYATVAMRFSLRDVTVERVGGRIVDGDPARPQEATELWTFRRDRSGPWLLSAIQQAR